MRYLRRLQPNGPIRDNRRYRGDRGRYGIHAVAEMDYAYYAKNRDSGKKIVTRCGLVYAHQNELGCGFLTKGHTRPVDVKLNGIWNFVQEPLTCKNCERLLRFDDDSKHSTLIRRDLVMKAKVPEIERALQELINAIKIKSPSVESISLTRGYHVEGGIESLRDMEEEDHTDYPKPDTDRASHYVAIVRAGALLDAPINIVANDLKDLLFALKKRFGNDDSRLNFAMDNDDISFYRTYEINVKAVVTKYYDLISTAFNSRYKVVQAVRMNRLKEVN